MLNSEDYLTIFHEIKNSITLIGSSLQLVEQKHPEVNHYAYWTETMSEVASLRDIVTELSSARLCNRLNLKPIQIYPYIQEILDSAHSLSLCGFRCEMIADDSLPVVELDARLIRHALVNLLKNACEAMNGTGTVRVRLAAQNDSLRIDVTDHGGGLDPAFADRIFEPFVTSKSNGSGLGLVITKQIVEAHHGTISCISRQGDGCTFTLTLPLKQN